jgi:hypothetical protein
MLARIARSSVAFVALAVVAAVAVACSAPADSAKKPLPICDATDPSCPGVPASKSDNKTHGDIPTDPVAVPDMATDDPAATTPTPPAPSPEAGVDAAPVVGQFCQQLATCCKDLGDAGYDTTMCKSVLSTNNEDACYSKHDSYKQSGDCI